MFSKVVNRGPYNVDTLPCTSLSRRREGGDGSPGRRPSLATEITAPQSNVQTTGTLFICQSQVGVPTTGKASVGCGPIEAKEAIGSFPKLLDFCVARSQPVLPVLHLRRAKLTPRDNIVGVRPAEGACTCQEWACTGTSLEGPEGAASSVDNSFACTHVAHCHVLALGFDLG